MLKKNFRCSKDIHTSCCFTRFVLIWTRIASGKLILLRRRILSVYLLHHAVRRSGLDRFSRIAKVKGEIGRKIEKEKERRRERKRKRERKREREHLANEKFYASTRRKKPTGTSLPSQLVAGRSEISPLLDFQWRLLHTGMRLILKRRRISIHPRDTFQR